MQKRKGQALIVVVVIIAVIMAIFANSYTTQLRFHSEQETEIYRREQALYLAETGINQMIFNMNNGTTYNNGDSISGNINGIGTYATFYHTPDNSGFGGSAYIESIGTVGSISRKVFASVQLGSTSDAFKYCLFTSPGGRDGINNDSYFTNFIYGNNYKYNNSQATIPQPDWTKYSTHWQKGYYFTGTSATYQPFYWNDNNKVVYIEARGTPPTTLTIDFQNRKKISLSIATNATNIIIKNMDGSFQWRPAKKFEGYTFPLITHNGSGKVEFDFNQVENFDETLKLIGFIYTAGHIEMRYYYFWLFGDISYGEIDGEIIEGNPQGKLGGSDGKGTTVKYIKDYYITPPPYFILPGDVTKVLPGSFREEF